MLLGLVALSLVALVARLYAANTVGFGDSEALYASYALFPAPAYLDHPGLVGLVARSIGHGLAPSPYAAHRLTAIAATLAPWAVALACRALGAGARGSLAAAVAVAVAPEVAVGLFGMTPDLILFFAWISAIALFGRALQSPPRSTAASALFLGAGLALGVACTAKVSGVTLAAAFLLVLGAPRARAHLWTPWPWTAFVLTGLLVAPVVAYEARTGWPMVHHRLVDTQHDAGVSLRNAAAIVFGQAGYVSPVLFACGGALALDLYRTRTHDIVRALLAATTFVPMITVGLLCLWSRVAEPHWLAPAWLSLPLYYAYRVTFPAPDGGTIGADTRETRFIQAMLAARVRRIAALVGGVASAIVYAWVLVPGLVALVPRSAYEPRLDIANELYGWPEVAADVHRIVDAERVPLGDSRDVIVVGSVWMVCAQLRASLTVGIAVGCAGSNVADFASWEPASAWSRADTLVLVYDNRAPTTSATLFPDRALVSTFTRTLSRGGQTARVFTIEVLSRRAAG